MRTRGESRWSNRSSESSKSNWRLGGSCCVASRTCRPSGLCWVQPSTCAPSGGCGASASSSIYFAAQSLTSLPRPSRSQRAPTGRKSSHLLLPYRLARLSSPVDLSWSQHRFWDRLVCGPSCVSPGPLRGRTGGASLYAGFVRARNQGALACVQAERCSALKPLTPASITKTGYRRRRLMLPLGGKSYLTGALIPFISQYIIVPQIAFSDDSSFQY